MVLLIIKEEIMRILGLQKLTLLDFPGRIACTVFTGGCNMRCPFCHNGDIVLGGCDEISVDSLLAFLDSRVGRLGGVCISGGEPTLHSDLPDLIREIKQRGFAVKLDTNGTNPKMLAELIKEGLLDYVAMDIKNSPERYAESAGLNAECGMQNAELIFDKVKQSAAILMGGEVDFEFRTTIARELHGEEDMISIGKWLKGDEKLFLQTYRDEGELLVGGFTPFNREETERLLAILREFVPNAAIRE